MLSRLAHSSSAALMPRPLASTWMRRSLLLPALLLLLLDATATSANEICNSVTTCRRNGGVECDRNKETCPPCIYALVDKYTCWEKDNVTNTCPFTGVKYDCSSVWTTNGNSTSTTTTTTPVATKSVTMYAAIGGGVLLVVIVLVCLLIRRRRRGRNMPKFVMSDSPPTAFNTKRGAKNSTANTPYSNVPDTSKSGAQPYSYQRKMSDPALLESSAVRTAPSNYTNTTADSLDGMLVDNTPPTAVLGDPVQRTRSKRALSKGFSRLNSGGSRRESSKFVDKIDLNARYTTNNNLLGEYLKTKQEMKYDVDSVTDYGSDTMSLDRFSVQSGSTVGGGAGGGRAMSITDSEYNAELMRSRTESECYSEMSYNDEKYSFSEEDAELMLSASHIGKAKPDKEIEI